MLATENINISVMALFTYIPSHKIFCYMYRPQTHLCSPPPHTHRLNVLYEYSAKMLYFCSFALLPECGFFRKGGSIEEG